MSSNDLQIRLLGPVEATVDRRTIVLPPSRKVRALLGYLIATDRPHGRTPLCELLWNEAKDPRAGLRWALSKLRSVVDRGEQSPIVTSRHRVAFEADGVQIDLHDVWSVGPDEPVETVERAVSSFRGEFLEDLDLPDCHDFDTWCLGMREDLRARHSSLRRSLVERLRGEPESALPHALARIRLEPYDEEAYVDAMDVLSELGSLGRGIDLYERCRRVLGDELGVTPSPLLDEARRRLVRPGSRGPGRRASEEQPSRRSGGSRGDIELSDLVEVIAQLSPPDGLTEPGAADPPLVGRQQERDILSRTARLAAERAEKATLLLTGEPGIGKTRLLRELVGEVRAAGGWALCGAVFEAEGLRPYGPWTDLIRAIPVAALGNDLQRDLSVLLADAGRDERGDEPTEQARLFEAVSRLLERLATARAPGLVVLDDVQWLDPSSAGLLHYLVRKRSPAPLVIALAAREEEMEPGSLQARTLRSLAQSGALRRLALGRLDASETESLVQAVGTTLDAEQVFNVSEGNPLFALTLMTERVKGIGNTTTTIREELANRLERLDPSDRSLLPWTAALGRSFEVSTLVRVAGRPAPDIVEAVGRLERRGILHPVGETGYDFSHSLLRQAAYRGLSEPMRRAVHSTIARALEGSDEPSLRSPSIVAHHAELGGLHELASRSFRGAAELSLWQLALDEAAEQVARGLSQVEYLHGESRISLEMELLRVYGFRNMRDRRPEDVETRVRGVTEAARAAALTEVVAVGHAVLTELEYQRGAFDVAVESSIRSAEAGRESGPLTAIRALAKTGACLLLLDHAPEDARRLTAESLALAEEHQVKVDVAALAQALLHHHDGELENAVQAFHEVILLGKRDQDRWWESPALSRMTMVELDREDPLAAGARAREAEQLAERLGDETEAVYARGLVALAAETLALSEKTDESASRAWDAVDEALRELKVLDSLWHIGHVQAYASELELRKGCTQAARKRAEEAATAARLLNQPSLLALSHAVLAHVATACGSPDEAERHLDAAVATRPYHRLSHRARLKLRRVRELITG